MHKMKWVFSQRLFSMQLKRCIGHFCKMRIYEEYFPKMGICKMAIRCSSTNFHWTKVTQFQCQGSDLSNVLPILEQCSVYSVWDLMSKIKLYDKFNWNELLKWRKTMKKIDIRGVKNNIIDFITWFKLLNRLIVMVV